MRRFLSAAIFFLASNIPAVEQLPFDGDVFTVEGNPAFIIEPEKREELTRFFTATMSRITNEPNRKKKDKENQKNSEKLSDPPLRLQQD